MDAVGTQPLSPGVRPGSVESGPLEARNPSFIQVLITGYLFNN